MPTKSAPELQYSRHIPGLFKPYISPDRAHQDQECLFLLSLHITGLTRLPPRTLSFRAVNSLLHATGNQVALLNKRLLLSKFCERVKDQWPDRSSPAAQSSSKRSIIAKHRLVQELSLFSCVGRDGGIGIALTHALHSRLTALHACMRE